jgi:Fe-S-cluster-containing hydrogenase component 2/Ni/Fe-hydrogenase subunit HybB-like protein
VRRHFTVLRCNQCTDAPCVTICPVTALDKRDDGIVDVDPKVCIGCKGCMQACPYDALYIHDESGTAQKCHFCAHRTEMGLAPACAIVCPTEAIILGDFHDPDSRVSRMRARGDLTARKVEAETGPNVFYKAADPSGVDPNRTNEAGGFIWANQQGGVKLDAQEFELYDRKARHAAEDLARTVYNVEHPSLWGGKVTSYLFTKSLAGGIFLAGALLMPATLPGRGLTGVALAWIPGMSLFFLAITSALLVADLKRPERFLFILTRPNWRSWIARGAYILVAYGALLVAWLFLALAPAGSVTASQSSGPLVKSFIVLTAIAAALTAGYTASLFAQSRGRVLWMKRGMWLHLIAQAFLGGAALLMVLAPWIGLGLEAVGVLRRMLLVALVLHAGLTLVHQRLAPRRRHAEFARVARLVSHGPFERRHSWIGLVLGVAVPALTLLLFMPPLGWSVGAVLALVGLYVEEDVLVRAGQALPIS